MNKLETDPDSLLAAEIGAFLKEHGLKVSLELQDSQGHAPSPETLAKLAEVAEAHAKNRDWERRMVELGQLSAGVTHEARNVIAGIVGLSQLSLSRARNASESGEHPPDLTTTLQTISREAQRGVELLSSYLGFANSRKQSAQVVAVTDLIDPVIQLTAHEAKVRGCRVTTNVAPGLPEIVLRASEIREVLINLLINALHAVEREGHIEIAADQHDNSLLIRVTDDGPGVPDQHKTKIFDAFFTTKPAGKGTGLGLALAARVVKAHGGSLEVRDGEHGGAEFVMNLPLERDVLTISEGAPPR